VGKKTGQTCRLHLGMTRACVVAAIAAAISGSSVALVPGAVPGVAAQVLSSAAAASPADVSKAPAPAYLSVFTPRVILPTTLEAPSPAQAGAFAALNSLIDMEVLCGDAVIGMRVALDRAEAALSARNKAASASQTNASAEYALDASRLLGNLPGLQVAMVRAFAGDKLSLRLTSAQFAAGKAKFLRGLPAGFMHTLEAMAGVYQPSTVPEVAAVRAGIVNMAPFDEALANMAPRAVTLPAPLASSAITAPELRTAAELETYANIILHPVPASQFGPMAARPRLDGRLVVEGEAGEQAGEALHGVSEGFEGLGAGAKTFGGEAGTGAAETTYEPLGEAFGAAFSYIAFEEAISAFGAGTGGGEGAGGSNSGASYGEPHEMTFSGAEYAFQAAGEFTLVKSTTGDLDIQVREQRFPGAADVALDTATSMRVGSDIVELAGTSSGDLQLWLNRQPVPYASRALAGGGRISVDDAEVATVTWPDGTAVDVFSRNTIAINHEVVTCNDSDAINVAVTVPSSLTN